MIDLQIEHILSTAAGGAACAAVARHVILKALNDLSKISEHVHSINAKLSAFEVQLRSLDKVEGQIASHAREIAELSGRIKHVSEKPRKIPPSNFNRMQKAGAQS